MLRAKRSASVQRATSLSAAASSAGSLLGLVAYATLVEANLGLVDQGRWWSIGFGVFALAVTPPGWTVKGAIRHRYHQAAPVARTPAKAAASTARRVLSRLTPASRATS